MEVVASDDFFFLVAIKYPIGTENAGSCLDPGSYTFKCVNVFGILIVT